MGWLELLPLLKRVLPLLGRIAPMLETFVAARGGARADTDAAVKRFAGVLDRELANTAQRHEDLGQLLAAQASDLSAIRGDVAKIRASDDRTTARLLEIELQVGAFGRTLRIAAILLGVLLAICAGLLIAVLLNKGVQGIGLRRHPTMNVCMKLDVTVCDRAHVPGIRQRAGVV